MKQKFTEVVEAFTQEHWDAILKYADEVGVCCDYVYSDSCKNNRNHSCLNFNKGDSLSYGSREFYIKSLDTHPITFEQFSKKYLGVPEKPNQVVDIDSNTKGSGARYNNGKPDYSLLIISDVLPTLSKSIGLSPAIDTVISSLVMLGEFQKTHDVTFLHRSLEILGLDAIEESTHVFTYGAAKYKAWNWTKGANWSVPLACAVRHSLKILNGEDVDDESNRKHIGHIVCNILMLIHYSKHYQEGNDLPDAWMFGN